MKIYPADKIRNVTLLGHGGVGKSSVIEAMLYDAKHTERMGTAKDGNLVTDFDQEEIRRGVSINTNYAACEWKGCKLNLIDTPGDFDFISEQWLGLTAGDIALIVVSAKDPGAVGAEKAMRVTEKNAKPTAIVINRVDEPNASFPKSVEKFRELYGNKVVPLSIPILEGEEVVGMLDVLADKAYRFGQRGALTEMDIPEEAAMRAEVYRENLTEQIAEADEELMMKFFEGEPFTKEERERGLELAIQTRSLIPVFCSAASLGLGLSFLMDELVRFFPSAATAPAVEASCPNGEIISLPCDKEGPLAAFVFKTIIDPFVGRISLFRVFSGRFTSEDNGYNMDTEKEERINGLFVMRGKKQIPVEALEAGDLGAVTKLLHTQTNQTLSLKEKPLRIKPLEIPAPCLTRAISPVNRGEEDKIMQGMNRLKDEDPSFEIVNDPETHQLLLSGQGEVQLDILCAKLKGKYGTEAVLEEPRVAYRETIRKKVKVQGRHKKQSGGHGQFGDVWIVFEPGEQEELEFCEEIFGGSVPKNYFPAVEKGLQEAISEGVLAGYPVVNLKATLVDGSYHDVDSNEMSFKLAARLAYRSGLPQADPTLLEPIASVKVHIPDESLGDILGDISKRRGRILGMGAAKIQGYQVVEGEAPMSELLSYATDIKSMTAGRGWFTLSFARYEQAPNEIAEKVIALAKAADE